MRPVRNLSRKYSPLSAGPFDSPTLDFSANDDLSEEARKILTR